MFIYNTVLEIQHVQCAKKHHQTNSMTNIYLENLWEETWADLLAYKVIYSRQAGHGAAQCPVRGRSGPVRSVNPVHKRIWSLRVQVILVHNEGPEWHSLAHSKFYHERLHISDGQSTLQFRGQCDFLTIKSGRPFDQVKKSYSQIPVARPVRDRSSRLVRRFLHTDVWPHSSHSCFR